MYAPSLLIRSSGRARDDVAVLGSASAMACGSRARTKTAATGIPAQLGSARMQGPGVEQQPADADTGQHRGQPGRPRTDSAAHRGSRAARTRSRPATQPAAIRGDQHTVRLRRQSGQAGRDERHELDRQVRPDPGEPAERPGDLVAVDLTRGLQRQLAGDVGLAVGDLGHAEPEEQGDRAAGDDMPAHRRTLDEQPDAEDRHERPRLGATEADVDPEPPRPAQPSGIRNSRPPPGRPSRASGPTGR